MICEAVLFDMDGVIVDTCESVTAFWRKLAETHQVYLSRDDFDQHVYGCPAAHTLDYLFPQLTDEERRNVIWEMAEYEMHLSYSAVPGAAKLVRALRRSGILLALVTSGEQWKVDAVCGQLGLDGMFQSLVTASDIRQGKPYPECYLLASSSLNVSPERCLVFEDSISGVQAAVASRALCVGVQPPRLAAALLKAGAWCVVPDFAAVGLTPGDGRPGMVSLRLDEEHSVLLCGVDSGDTRGR